MAIYVYSTLLGKVSVSLTVESGHIMFESLALSSMILDKLSTWLLSLMDDFHPCLTSFTGK